VRRGFVETSIGQIHYREDGAGPPLVLLHRTADSSTQWLDVAPCLAERYRLIAPDTPGFGDSDPPPSPLTMEDYAGVLAETLDSIGVRRFALLGHRTGATIAAEYAALYPDRVTRLILSGCPDYDDAARARMDMPSHDFPSQEDGSHFARAWTAARANLGPWASLEQVRRSALDSLRAAPDAHAIHVAIYRQDLHARLAAITAPTLLLYGEDDRFSRWAPSLASFLHDGRAQILPGANALTMLHQPGAFCAAVTSFLDS
jgi:pimeloyl-ACP methyl ester carboxylesterase